MSTATLEPRETPAHQEPVVLRRFDPVEYSAGVRMAGSMEEAVDGDFVKYEDVIKESVDYEGQKPLAWFAEHPKTLDSFVFWYEQSARDKAAEWENEFCDVEHGERVEITPLFPNWEKTFVTDLD